MGSLKTFINFIAYIPNYEHKVRDSAQDHAYSHRHPCIMPASRIRMAVCDRSAFGKHNLSNPRKEIKAKNNQMAHRQV